jgi:arginine decarboxylase-like protein
MIVSESGRAIAAYHSVLIFDTLGSSALDKFQVTGDPALDYQGSEELPQPVMDLFDAYRTVSARRLVECYHDALTAREQVLQMFNLGLLSLEFRAIAERLYWATCAKIRDFCRKVERSRTRISATSRCSSRCRTAGRSISCSRSCRSTVWTSGPPAPACSPTSPATRTARSIASYPCGT